MKSRPIAYIHGYIGTQYRLLGLVYADCMKSDETAARVADFKLQGYDRVHVSTQSRG